MGVRLPKLDDRLSAVATRIRSRTHADIGSDHGHLLVALIETDRIQRGIAIENKRHPYENSAKTLAGLNAEVRFADGLAGLRPGEADSLSICGMGGRRIAQILGEFPDRVPTDVVLQPNRNPELVRAWGIQSGFHLVDECVARWNWSHHVLHFRQSELAADPAYDDVDLDAALLFGPLVISRREPEFVHRLGEEHRHLSSLHRLSERSARRLVAIRRIL